MTTGVVVLATLIVISACTSSAASQHGAASSVVPATAASTSMAAPPSAAARQSPVRSSPHPRRSKKPTPTRAATRGGVRVNRAGAILPDPRRTPGAINSAVTQSSIGRTICVTGWTATIRPPSSYTTGLKERQLATGYAYRGDTATGDYEEDHLISLELGGSPTAARNLWPEPYAATDGARTKDSIENTLHRLVCAGSISLATAQHAIARNWYSAYLRYIGTPTTRTATRTRTPTPVRTTTSNPGAGATALCTDGTYSYAAHHQGACSHHGGVKVFYR